MKGAEMSVPERILQELQEIYNNPKNGLILMGQKIGIEILPPKKKITVLLIGNHSAGKSSFINWYIGENVQKTGMAIETQSFTVVASGKKRESLMGSATVFLFPHLKPLEKMKGVLDYLSAEISTSKKRQFSMTTFIDSPGLVDGGMEYPFSVNDTISLLGKVADLVFVFFEPIGLALCKRTMTIVEKIYSENSEKINFVLAKSDEIRTQKDKLKIMMQITQEVCRSPGLNRAGFSMPCIYIPALAHGQARHMYDQDSNKPVDTFEKSRNYTASEDDNDIDEVCKKIDQTISRNLQIALNKFENDVDAIFTTINEKVTNHEKQTLENSALIFLTLMTAVIYIFLFHSTKTYYSVGRQGLDYVARDMNVPESFVQMLIAPVTMLIHIYPVEKEHNLYLTYICSIVIIFFLFRKELHIKPTLPSREVKELGRFKKVIENDLMKKKVEMTQAFLNESYDV